MLSRRPGGVLSLPEVLFASLDGIAHAGIAVSGGPDSLALMLLAVEWANTRKPPVRLTVYSVDHGLRPEAAAEVAFVAETAARFGLAARPLKWEGPKPKGGVQAAAREARYRLIGEAMRADGAEILLTAHHRRDQAETVLMRLAHGSGLGGLGGMAALGEAEGVQVCRPLLDVSPETLAAIVAGAGLTPVADPSNADAAYERIRWRNFLPRLLELGLDEGRLSLFSRRARRADDALGEMAAQRFAADAEIDGFGVVRIAEGAFMSTPEEIRIRVLQLALRAAGGGQKPFDLQPVEALEAALRQDKRMPRRTLHGAMVEKQGGAIVFTREAARAGAAAEISPGRALVWDGRFEIRNGTAMPVTVKAEPAMTRKRLETHLGVPYHGPMAGPRSAPMICSRAGELLALGSVLRHSGLEIARAFQVLMKSKSERL